MAAIRARSRRPPRPAASAAAGLPHQHGHERHGPDPREDQHAIRHERGAAGQQGQHEAAGPEAGLCVAPQQGQQDPGQEREHEQGKDPQRAHPCRAHEDGEVRGRQRELGQQQDRQPLDHGAQEGHGLRERVGVGLHAEGPEAEGDVHSPPHQDDRGEGNQREHAAQQRTALNEDDVAEEIGRDGQRALLGEERCDEKTRGSRGRTPRSSAAPRNEAFERQDREDGRHQLVAVRDPARGMALASSRAKSSVARPATQAGARVRA